MNKKSKSIFGFKDVKITYSEKIEKSEPEPSPTPTPSSKTEKPSDEFDDKGKLKLVKDDDEI